MWKVSHSILAIAVVGISIVSFWVYQKYIRSDDSAAIHVTISRGDLKEVIRARGEVIPEREYNLEFSGSGVIDLVYVEKGDVVQAGAPLIALDTNELFLEERRLQALVEQRTAERAKLGVTASAIDISLYASKVESARGVFDEADKALTLQLRAVFSAMDDAVRTTTDLYYTNLSSPNPTLSFSTSNLQLSSTLSSERHALTEVLARAANAASTPDLDALSSIADTMQLDAKRVGAFLDNNIQVLSAAISSSGISASDISSWQSLTMAARTALNTKASTLGTAIEVRSAARAALTVAEKELESRQSPARPEDIAAADALIKEAQSQIALVREKIRKATLRAPEKSLVASVLYREGEAFRSGSPAVTLQTLTPQIQSDVSELDIVRVQEHNGQAATFTFDALPGKDFSGAVSSIEPKKIIKDGDTYYRVLFSLTDATSDLRPGMSADVYIVVSAKEQVLRIPEYAFIVRDKEMFVLRIQEGQVTEVKVETGVSDGEYVEVLSGLEEGDEVVVPTE